MFLVEPQKMVFPHDFGAFRHRKLVYATNLFFVDLIERLLTNENTKGSILGVNQ